METKLYLISIRGTTHYYVRCTVDELTAWLDLLTDMDEDAAATEIKLSDFDEINHLHFC